MRCLLIAKTLACLMEGKLKKTTLPQSKEVRCGTNHPTPIERFNDMHLTSMLYMPRDTKQIAVR